MRTTHLPLLIWLLCGWCCAVNAQETAQPQGAAAEQTSAAEQAAAAGQADAANENAEPYRWTTQLSFSEIDLSRLQQRLAYFGLEFPVDSEGIADVALDVSIPLTLLGDAKAYRIQGDLTVRQLRLGDARFEQLRASVLFENGELLLRELELRQRGARVMGTAKLQLAPQGLFDAKLVVSQLDLQPIFVVLDELQLIPGVPLLQGKLNAKVDASGDVSTIDQVATWSIKGSASLSGFRIGNSLALNLSAKEVVFSKEQLNVAEFEVASAETRSANAAVSPGRFVARGSITGKLAPTLDLQAKLFADDLPTQDLAGIVLSDPARFTEGKLDLQAIASIRQTKQDASPQVTIQAAIASPNLRVLGVDLGLLEHNVRLTPGNIQVSPRQPEVQSLNIQNVDVEYAVSESGYEIKRISASMFGGDLQGSGFFSVNDADRHQIDARWNDLRPEIRVPVPPVFSSRQRFASLSVQSSGSLSWSCSSKQVLSPRSHEGKARIQLGEIFIADRSECSLNVDLQADDGQWNGRIEGTLFGGQIQIAGRAFPEQADRFSDLLERIRIEAIELSSLSLEHIDHAIGANTQLTGEMSATVEVTDGSLTRFGGVVSAELRNLGVQHVSLSERLRAEFHIEGNTIRLKQLSGNYAGGSLSADGVWSLGNGPSFLSVSINRASGNRLLLPVDKDAASWLGGRVSGSGTLTGPGNGSLTPLRFNGTARVQDGTVFGVPIGNAHSPVGVAVSSSAVALNFPSVDSSVARGRLHGALRLSVPLSRQGGVRLSSHWRLNHVDFENLLHTYAGTSTIGQGDVTGKLTLNGNHIRSIKDLDGSFQFQLGGSDASAMPGLSTAGTLLGAAALTGVRFENGEMQGRIARGIVDLQSVSLTSDRVRVGATGKLGLVDQRMDIEATLATGDFEGQSALLRKVGAAAVTEFIPLAELNRAVSNRIIVVAIRGHLSNPFAQLQLGETIRLNTRRTLTRRAMGLIIADNLLSD